MRATPPTGLPVLRPLSSFMHASANTPAGAASASIALFPAATGLPLFRAGSTPTLPVSGPARRSLTFRPACSLNRLSRSFCQSASIHVVTSMNRPDCYQPETIVAGRDSHPLERGAFHGARGSRAEVDLDRRSAEPAAPDEDHVTVPSNCPDARVEGLRKVLRDKIGVYMDRPLGVADETGGQVEFSPDAVAGGIVGLGLVGGRVDGKGAGGGARHLVGRTCRQCSRFPSRPRER